MPLSPSLEEAILLLDDKPTGWRDSMAQLYYSGKLNADDKNLLVVLAGGEGAGGNVNALVSLLANHLVVGGGTESVKVADYWTVDDGTGQLTYSSNLDETAAMSVTMSGETLTGIYVETTGDLAKAVYTQTEGDDSAGSYNTSSGANSAAVYGSNEPINELQAAGIGVLGRTAVNEDGIGVMAETTTADSWAFVCRNETGSRVFWKFLATAPRQVNVPDLDGTFLLEGGNIPVGSGSTGVRGEVAWDSTYFYVCIATNTWARASIGNF